MSATRWCIQGGGKAQCDDNAIARVIYALPTRHPCCISIPVLSRPPLTQLLYQLGGVLADQKEGFAARQQLEAAGALCGPEDARATQMLDALAMRIEALPLSESVA